MKRCLSVVLVVFASLHAESIQSQIEDVERQNAQKEIFERQKQEQRHASPALEVKPIPLLNAQGVSCPTVPTVSPVKK